MTGTPALVKAAVVKSSAFKRIIENSIIKKQPPNIIKGGNER
jgi:hypothetical protein